MIKLISIHIPKTAGRTFLSILNEVYLPLAVKHFDRKNYKGQVGNPVEMFKQELSGVHNVIHGHFTYAEISDIHKKHQSRIITWLRDPVERVISNYSFFMKRISENPEDQELKKRKDESLLMYAKLENSRNRMSKFLDGINLEQLYFVGFTERFDTDVKTLGVKLNWPDFIIPHVNDNTSFKVTLPEVSDKEKSIIADLNNNDIDLYLKARKYFDYL